MADKRSKYHFALIEEQTLREVFHFRVSLLGAITTITLSIIGLIILLSILIVFTPLRNIMPGYGASIREQLIEQSAKVDSLQSSLTVQRQYLDVIKQLTAGDIEMDSVQSLDSLQRVEKARLDAGEAMPEYLKNHPIYYAGPAKTPAGMACGSMGPTTAGRMDP